MARLQEIASYFNSMEVETVFNAPEVAKVLAVSTKDVHGFLTPVKMMGAVIRWDIVNRVPGRKRARVEFMKVRSLTKEEGSILCRRSDAIEFYGRLLKVHRRNWIVKKLIEQQHYPDQAIAKYCNVPQAFVSKVRSHIAAGTVVSKVIQKKEQPTIPTEVKTLTIDDETFYKVKGSVIKQLRTDNELLSHQNAQAIDENVKLNTQNRILNRKVREANGLDLVDLSVFKP
jgi:hypothetical protein